MNERDILETPLRRTTDRTCRVPLKIPSAQQWAELRRLAFRCASFGNHVLTDIYAKSRGVSGLSPYTDYSDVLSSAIRDAVNKECASVWRRLGREIQQGKQTLARFRADRALVIRERGVLLKHAESGDVFLSVRLHPKHKGPLTVFRVWMPALRRDEWLSDVLKKIEAGAYPLTKLTLQFRRPGRKIIALLSYRLPITESSPGCMKAMLEYACGELRLSSRDHTISLNDNIHRLTEMKLHFAHIHSRLRTHLGKPGRSRALRRALVKAGTFERWAEGPLHQLSSEIIEWCRRYKSGTLQWNIKNPKPDLPWARLASLLQYKAKDAGIQFHIANLSAETEEDMRELESDNRAE